MKLPKQKQIPYLGGFYTLACIVMSLISFGDLILRSRLYYYNVGDSLLKDIFGSYLLYMVACGFAGIILLIFAWMFLLPSNTKFVQEQSVIDGRNPMFEKILNIEKEILDIKTEIQELKNEFI